MKKMTLLILGLCTLMSAQASSDSSYDRRRDDIRRDNRLYQQRQDNIRRDDRLYQQRQDNINRDNLLYQQRQDAIRQEAIKQEAIKQDQLRQDQIKQDQLKQEELKQQQLKQNAPTPTLQPSEAPEIKTSAEGIPQTQPSQIESSPTTGPQL